MNTWLPLLRICRISVNLSPWGFAETIRMNKQAYLNIEKGHREPTQQERYKIIKGFENILKIKVSGE